MLNKRFPVASLVFFISIVQTPVHAKGSDCPAGWIVGPSKKQCFRLVLIKGNWFESKYDCLKMYPKYDIIHMATIHDEETNTFVCDLVKGVDELVWIGLTKVFYKDEFTWDDRPDTPLGNYSRIVERVPPMAPYNGNALMNSSDCSWIIVAKSNDKYLGVCEILDIDDCSIGNVGCQHTCNNLIKGYECACQAGYQLVNGTHCEVPKHYVNAVVAAGVCVVGVVGAMASAAVATGTLTGATGVAGAAGAAGATGTAGTTGAQVTHGVVQQQSPGYGLLDLADSISSLFSSKDKTEESSEDSV